jgi:hypothetical protein|tara:strand:+ start:301 stop:447 length:147 start_codon:yes stop_codon:yes gene_type:complete
MNSKDFIQLIKNKMKESKSKLLSTYSFKQRNSRPRTKKNIINKDMSGI